MGRRHSLTGGEAAQSVLIRTPRTTPLRSGPRNPGQPAAVSGAAGPGGSAADVPRAESRGSVAARDETGFSGLFAAGGTAGSAADSAPDWGRSRFLGHLHCRGRRRERGGLVSGLRHEPLLGSFRPAPGELRSGVASDATGLQERPHSTPEQDGRDHCRTPETVRAMAAGRHRRDEHEARGLDGVDGHHQPHQPSRNRLVDDARCSEHGDDHQDDGARAIVPTRPAQEDPPQDDGDRTEESANHSEADVLGQKDRHDVPEQTQHHRGDQAGPQSERLPRQRFVSVCVGHMGLYAARGRLFLHARVIIFRAGTLASYAGEGDEPPRAAGRRTCPEFRYQNRNGTNRFVRRM